MMDNEQIRIMQFNLAARKDIMQRAKDICQEYVVKHNIPIEKEGSDYGYSN